MHTLYEYCLMYPRAHFILKHSHTKEGRNKGRDLNKAPLQDHLTVVSLLFGPQVADTLTEISIENNDEEPYPWSMYGLVPALGADSEHCSISKDNRIFFYINSRPVDLKNIKQVVVNSWRAHNNTRNRYPFIFMNFILPPGFCDVNLSANKRRIEIVNEDVLLEHIKKKMFDFYKPNHVPSSETEKLTTPGKKEKQQNGVSPDNENNLRQTTLDEPKPIVPLRLNWSPQLDEVDDFEPTVKVKSENVVPQPVDTTVQTNMDADLEDADTEVEEEEDKDKEKTKKKNKKKESGGFIFAIFQKTQISPQQKIQRRRMEIKPTYHACLHRPRKRKN